MNKDIIVYKIKNELDTINTLMGELVKVKQVAETITHWKTIDGKYLNKLQDAITENRCYIKKGYVTFEGKLDSLELHISKPFKEYNKEAYYYIDRTCYIQEPDIKQLTPDKVLACIDDAFTRLRDEYLKLSSELDKVDTHINAYNAMIDTLIRLDGSLKDISYTFRRNADYISLPYVSEHLKIRQ